MARGLARALDRFDVLAVVMGAIVGVGIFFQPGAVARLTGSAPVSLATWILGGLIALAGALTFAELGCLYPATGGQYLVLRETYGPAVGFLYCWALLTVIVSGAIGIIAILCVRYLGKALGHGFSEPGAMAAAIALIAGLAALNASGLKRGARLARIAMVLKAVAIAAIAAVGLLARGGDGVPAVAPPAPGTMGDGSWLLLAPALIPVLFSFGGWQQATFLAGEVKEPGRALPFGIIGGVAGVTVLYLSLNLGYLSLLGVERMATTETLAADAVGAVFPGAAERLVSLAVAISALGITSVCLLTTPRMYKAIADDGSFFAAVGRVHPTLGTPANAILLQAAIAIVLLLVAGFDGVDRLTTGVVCIDWIFFTLTGVALFVLRRTRPLAPRPYRAWGYPVIPALFVVAGVGAVIASFVDAKTRAASGVAVVVLASGSLSYPWFRRRSRSGAAIGSAPESEPATDEASRP